MDKKNVNEIAQKVAVHAASKSRTAGGWLRWLWFVIAVAAGAVFVFTQTGCLTRYTQNADAASFQISVLPNLK